MTTKSKRTAQPRKAMGESKDSPSVHKGQSAEKTKRGAPTKYKPEYAAQAEKLAMLGMTDAQLAAFFEVREQTINNWKNSHPEFFDALKDGKAVADANVAVSLYKRATGYSHDAVKIFNDQGAPLVVPYTEHYPPDTTACIFWLKNRRPSDWRDKRENEDDTESEGAIRVVEYTGMKG